VVPEVMLIADYLLQRKDVDPDRLFLVGYSFGALCVPSVAAVDPRFRAAAMVDGGGDLGRLVRFGLKSSYDGVSARLAGWIAGRLLAPVEPLRYVARIAPRPFVMINSSADELIPRECVLELFGAAREPKRLGWLDAGHVGPGDPELLRRTAKKLIREFTELKLLPAPPATD
jgi:dienelactone hydrolase